MANVIKLKNASGSDPSASDLVVGEVALRTDNAKLFTKKDDNSVAEIGVTALGNNDVTTSTIEDDAVTYAKIQNVSATNRILGRDSSGAGVIEEITPANLRTMLNVEDGATADQTNSEIKTAYEANSDTNAFTDALLSKLNGIAASATNVTNTNQLTNGAGFITATLTNEQVQDIVGGMVSGNTESGITVTYQDGDGTLDFSVASQTDNNFTNSDHSKLDGIESGATADQTANEILTLIKTVDGSGSGLDADTLDGVSSASFVRSDASDTLTGATYTFDASTDEKIILSGATNPYIRFREGSTTKAYIQWNASGFFALVNQESSEQLRIGSGSNGLIFLEGGSERTVYHTGNLSVGDGGLTENNFTDSDHSKLNGIASGATNVTNNNQLTNGAGYITSANGGNAATLDNLDSTEFLRSNTADSASGILSLSAGLSFGSDSRCAAGISGLSDGSTITVNFTSGIHHSVTLGGNRTFGNPSNDGSAVGQCGSIFITQDGTGSRTASFHSDYKFAGGTAPTLSTAANAVDRLDYVIKASGVIHCVVTLDVK